MNNVTEILESISNFSEFVSARALELVIANGYKRKFCLDKIKFETKRAVVGFEEDTTIRIGRYEINKMFFIDLERDDNLKKICEYIRNTTKISES
jgi:hypothetical protein